jgi:hypothetical protein
MILRPPGETGAVPTPAVWTTENTCVPMLIEPVLELELVLGCTV